MLNKRHDVQQDLFVRAGDLKQDVVGPSRKRALAVTGQQHGVEVLST